MVDLVSGRSTTCGAHDQNTIICLQQLYTQIFDKTACGKLKSRGTKYLKINIECMMYTISYMRVKTSRA